MSNKDWENDELLNFDYSHPIPEQRTSTRVHRLQQNNPQFEGNVDDAIRREEERARQLKEEYERIRAASKAQRNTSEQVEFEIPCKRVTSEEQARANQIAQQEAYMKFRQQYSDDQTSKTVQPERKPEKKYDKKAEKKARKNEAKLARKAGRKSAARSVADGEISKFYKFTKILSIPYVALFAAFIASITLMNVLPFFWWVSLLVVLGLLSIIIVAQLRKVNIKKWAKVVSTTMAVILMFIYGVGIAYSMGTLSFLNDTSVDNEKAVGKITKEPFNVMMTGLDVRGFVDEQGRSDVNMLVTVNPVTETILMTSIPRDYEIRMPDYDYATDKLTHTGFYSVQTTMGAEEDLLQTEINYYVKVNFSTVQVFINQIGGIDVYSEYEFNPVKRPEWTVKQGWNHMNGKQALAFARERKAFEDGDRQRIKNQQLVFEAMIKKATSSKTMLLNYNKIVSKMHRNFEMSFSSREIRQLLKFQLARNPKWKIYKNSITGGDGRLSTYTGGVCYVMTQDAESIANAQNLIIAVQEGKELKKDKEGNITVVGEVADEEATAEAEQ